MFLNIFRIRAFAHLFDAGQSWRNTTSRGTSGDGQVVLYVETDPETLLGTTGDDQVVLFDETNPEILHGTTGEERDVLAYGLVWGNTVIRDAMEEEDAGPSSRNATPLGTTGEDQVVLYVETDPEILLGITGDDQDVLYDETDPKIQLGTTGGERDVLTYGWVQGNTVLLRLGTTDDGLYRRGLSKPSPLEPNSFPTNYTCLSNSLASVHPIALLIAPFPNIHYDAEDACC
ncbi:hypothetical protein quinque_004030 [Culex quinquefasciatus]